MPQKPDREGTRERDQRAVLERTNAQRRKAGIAPLASHPALTRAAQAYAESMARTGRFDHTGPDGDTPATRAQKSGYRFVAIGENLALGQPTADVVVAGWMRSPGHRANLLRAEFQEIGVGVATGRRGRYWVQLFGTRR